MSRPLGSRRSEELSGANSCRQRPPVVSAHQQRESERAPQPASELMTKPRLRVSYQQRERLRTFIFHLSFFFFPCKFIYSEVNGERYHLSINLSILVL